MARETYGFVAALVGSPHSQGQRRPNPMSEVATHPVGRSQVPAA
jgi:hypothetical protein